VENSLAELQKPGKVERYPMVALPSSNYAGQPSAYCAGGLVTAVAQFLANAREGATHATGHGEPTYHETLSSSGPRTYVGEAEEVERLAFAGPFVTMARPASLPELDESSLGRVKLEAEFAHA
jgi:hypothetical protein